MKNNLKLVIRSLPIEDPCFPYLVIDLNGECGEFGYEAVGKGSEKILKNLIDWIKKEGLIEQLEKTLKWFKEITEKDKK